MMFSCYAKSAAGLLRHFETMFIELMSANQKSSAKLLRGRRVSARLFHLIVSLFFVGIIHAQTTSADPAAVFREGTQAMRMGQLDLAESDFKQVIALDPRSGAAHVNLGVAYMRDKRWDEAVVQLREAQKLLPNEPGIPLNIGLSYYRKGDFAAAIEPFSLSLKQAPESSQARYLLGLCYFFRNRFAESAAMLAPLWEKESNNLNYLYVLNIAAGKSSNEALEKRAGDQMLAIGQGSPEFHLYVGKGWLAKGDTSRALDEFRAAAAAKPAMPLAHYFIGRALLQQHDYKHAETEFLQDVGIEPDFPYSYEDLGLLYSATSDSAKAEQAYRHAIDHDNGLPTSYLGLARIYRTAGRSNDALRMIDRAVALAPESASVHFERGRILQRLGQKEKAQHEFATAAALLKSFNDKLQGEVTADTAADAATASQQ